MAILWYFKIITLLSTHILRLVETTVSPLAHGAFFFSDKNHIYINISRFRQFWDCRNIDKPYKNNFVKYTITNDKETLKLKISDQKDKNDTLQYQFFKLKNYELGNF